MRLSEKRRSAIYGAVHEEIMKARIDVHRQIVASGASTLAERVDMVIAQAMDRAGLEAIRAVTDGGAR